MAVEHLKKCSTSSVAIKEIQIKTTLRLYLTSIEWIRYIKQVTAHVGKDVE